MPDRMSQAHCLIIASCLALATARGEASEGGPLRSHYEERLGAVADLEAPATEPEAPTLPPVIHSTFLCEDGRDLKVAFHTVEPAKVVITSGRRTIELPQALSGSGARYTDGVTTFWNKGDQALFEWANGSTHCHARR